MAIVFFQHRIDIWVLRKNGGDYEEVLRGHIFLAVFGNGFSTGLQLFHEPVSPKYANGVDRVYRGGTG
jgi:hypothetical protein